MSFGPKRRLEGRARFDVCLMVEHRYIPNSLFARDVHVGR